MDNFFGAEAWFSKGRLNARWSTGHQLRLRAWPFPAAWAHEGTLSQWAPIRPRIGLSAILEQSSSGHLVTRTAYGRLLETIPEHIRSAVDGYPEYAWSLLRLVFRAPRALQLVDDSPALAFAIACGDRLGQVSREEVWARGPTMLNEKRSEVLRWLGLPFSQSAVRIFSRVPVFACGTETLTKLSLLLRSEERRILRLLRHVPHVNADVVELLSAPELLERLTPTFLAEVSEMATFRAYVAARLRWAARSYPTAFAGRTLPVIRSLQHFASVTSDLARRMPNVQQPEPMPPAAPGRALPGRFPPPPVRGNDVVVAICSNEELFFESVHQRNCVNRFRVRILKGRAYIYKVMAPERCTLSIVRDEEGWSIGELYQARNRPASPKTWSQVQKWLLTAPRRR